MRHAKLILILLLTVAAAPAATKPHLIVFGKATAVKFFTGPNEKQPMEIKIRPLYVDGKIKEFTTGESHDVTDRLFVVRRAFRLNDTLPEDSTAVPRWKWQRGAWLQVNRDTGRVSALTLPEFDPYYSNASWYRDYVAYCGISDNGEKVYAVVVQMGRRKPVLRKELGAAKGADVPDSECGVPDWQREPVRVTFEPVGATKMTFAIRGHAADLADSGDEQ
jgi:hypothetical protein